MTIRRVAPALLIFSSVLRAAQLVWALAAGSAPVVLPNIEGGPLSDRVAGIAVDRQGYVWIAGTTYSPVFPAPTPIDIGLSHPHSMFVAKVAPDGSRFVNVKVFPGLTGSALAMDAAGNVYVAGSGLVGGNVVLKFDPSGTQLPYPARPTFTISAMAVNGAGEVYLAGTAPPAFATSGSRAAVAKWSADGTAMIYSKTLSGSRDDFAWGIAVDGTGAAYLTGFTDSPDFPVTAGAYKTQASQFGSGFVTKVGDDGSLVWSTFLPEITQPRAIAVNASENAYVAGPGRVVKIDATGSKLVFSRAFSADVLAIRLDRRENVHLTGVASGSIPVFQGFEASFDSGFCPLYTASGTATFGWGKCSAGFAAALDATGENLLYATYLNSSTDGAGLSLTLDDQGNAYVGGEGGLAVAATNGASNDGGAFVVKLQQTGAPPLFTPASMINAAGFATGLARPGGIASIFCTGLMGIPDIIQASGYPLPRELAGVQVKINGIAAPLFSISDTGVQQINLQVPSEITSNTLNVEISQNGSRAWVWRVDTWASPPGLFAGAVQHGEDYSLVTVDAPAHAGEVVIVYGTGFGAVQLPAASGRPAPAVVSATVAKPTATVAGKPAEVLFAGLTPGLVGVYQLNIRLPADLTTGDQALVASLPPYQPYPCACGGATCGVLCPTVRLNSNSLKLPVR